jgi:hypothetical protein
MNDTTRELGGALGVAVIGSILSSHYTSAIAPAVTGLPAQAQEVARSSVGGAISVAGQLGEAGSALASAGRIAFVDGMQQSLLIAALTALVAAGVALYLLPTAIRTAWTRRRRPASSTPSAAQRRSRCRRRRPRGPGTRLAGVAS